MTHLSLTTSRNFQFGQIINISPPRQIIFSTHWWLLLKYMPLKLSSPKFPSMKKQQI